MIHSILKHSLHYSLRRIESDSIGQSQTLWHSFVQFIVIYKFENNALDTEWRELQIVDRVIETPAQKQ